MDGIRNKIEAGEFLSALDELLSLVHDENYDNLPEILEGITQIQKKDLSLREEQLEKIKPYIDDFDEDIQNLAMDIYMKNITKDLTSFEQKLEYIISTGDSLEAEARQNLVDFLINMYHILTEKEKTLISGLIENLNDELWNVRIKIIHFLDEILMNKPSFIKSFEDQLQILYDEKDIDVKKEGLDFLLRLFIDTYSVEDLKQLIENIPKSEWIVQEKIIYLVGKLGINRKDLIKPLAKELIYLLDHKDYLVSNAIKDAIQEILDYHIDIFDEAFIEVIENNEIDHIESIEELLKESVVRNGFERFYQIFELVSSDSLSLMRTMNSIIKKLNSTNSNLLDSLIYQLTEKILTELSQENYSKLKSILEKNSYYYLYLNCYQALNEIDIIDNKLAENRRKKLLNFLLEEMPDLSFLNLKKWIEVNLVDGPIDIDTIISKFQVERTNLLEFLEGLIEKGELNAVISNDTVALKADSPFEEEDLLFLKKWSIDKDEENPERHNIKLFIQIRNISGQKVNNLKIDIDYPTEFFEMSLHNKDKIPELLEPNQHLILTYHFERKSERISNPKTSNIIVMFKYRKAGDSLSIKKNLDVLFI